MPNHTRLPLLPPLRLGPPRGTRVVSTMLIIRNPSLDKVLTAACVPGPIPGDPVFALVLTYNEVIPTSFTLSAALLATNIAVVGLAFKRLCLVTIPPLTLEIVFP